jgi:hypothetical protein
VFFFDPEGSFFVAWSRFPSDFQTTNVLKCAGGATVWETRNEVDAWEYPERMVADGKGGIFICGGASTLEHEDQFASKVDREGKFLWTRYRAASSDGPTDFGLAADDSGNAFVGATPWAVISYDGDGNGNGKAGGSVTDPIVLLRYAFLGGAEPPCLKACDADGDGTVTGTTDAIYMLLHAFLGGPQPPPPSPACGEGLIDSLQCREPSPCP